MRGVTSAPVPAAFEPAARAAALSGDGRRALIADAREPALALWQVLPDRRRLGTAPVFATALAMDWTGDAAMIGVRDGGWRWLRGPALTLEGDPAGDRRRIAQIAISGDGGVAAVITASRLLEIHAKASRDVDRPDASRVRAVAVSRDGSTVAAGGSDATLHICTLADRGHAQLECGAGPILAVTISPDGTRAVAGTEHGELILWTRTAPHALLDSKRAGSRGWITALAMPNAGPFVAAGWTSGLIELWNTATGARVAEFAAEAEILALGAAGSNAIVAIDGSGRMHVLDFAS
jgi:WD40 repeat protein